ncbi:predicted protein [Naegleria gruberi]|uniref:Predicted protein n=1 Tax=Naegleria gruberi TaxID=5762 RepID=D2W4M7_NAEGR|nr:uncharacterized protein NAEGRDRAFT_76361 [Naegleria gruberi]EFC35975.1 predicted protein [Naegleria gruberi]|eukprot:XP_002668719.1 predicted protein [Naegleria gruberi strain NEG-M]
MAFYNDLSSFVVLSICGPISNDLVPTDNHKEISSHAKPCRSKIVEYIHRTENNLYSKLVMRKYVSDLCYESMCVATFEVGEEKAKLYRKTAEETKKQMEEDGMDPIMINCDYSNILMYGIVEYPDDECY